MSWKCVVEEDILTSTPEILKSGVITFGVAMSSNMSTPKKSRPLPLPEILMLHGITFDINVVQEQMLESLPIHVRILREGLLDFDSFVIRDALLGNDDIDEIPASAYRDRREIAKWEQERLREFIATAKDIWDGVHILQRDLATEPLWQDLFNRTIFKQKENGRSDRYPVISRSL
jgi:hypothetical protein